MSVTDWKEREKEQRRNDIISAAQKLFASKGYENVSMDDIANEIKLGKATLYRYFKSKESLYFAVVLRGARINHTMVMGAVKKARTGAERLAAVANASIAFRKKYPEYNQLNNYYYSGRFDLDSLINTDDAAETIDSQTVKENSRLTWEVFEAGYSAIKTGREDGTILPGMDSVELTIILSLIAYSLQNLSPMYKRLLEHVGIDHEQFITDAQAFAYQNILNK